MVLPFDWLVEAAHAMNHERKIHDCSASQYHNARFKAAAEELGLRVERVPHYGYALTILPHETAAHYADEIEGLRRVVIHRSGLTITAVPPKGDDGESDDEGEGDTEPRSRL